MNYSQYMLTFHIMGVFIVRGGEGFNMRGSGLLPNQKRTGYQRTPPSWLKSSDGLACRDMGHRNVV